MRNFTSLLRRIGVFGLSASACMLVGSPAMAQDESGFRAYIDGPLREQALRETLSSAVWPARNPDQNIADLRAQIDSLRNRIATLEQQESGRSRFLVSLGHELRNALGSVRNGVTVLSRLGEAEGQSAPREIIRRQLRVMERLVEDLAEAGRAAGSCRGLRRPRCRTESPHRRRGQRCGRRERRRSCRAACARRRTRVRRGSRKRRPRPPRAVPAIRPPPRAGFDPGPSRRQRRQRRWR